jgi:hypothetical protein
MFFDNQLRRALMRSNIINESTTFNDVNNDNKLMKDILLYLSLGLSMDPSSRGVGLLSDFDLFHRTNNRYRLMPILRKCLIQGK